MSIDKERIRAEILRRSEMNSKSYMQCFLKSDDARDSYGHMLKEDKALLDFIDSLPEDNPSEIEESFIGFATARLLKNKGFKEKVRTKYNSTGEFIEETYKNNWNNRQEEYSAPTLTLTLRWLRELHNIHIWIGHNPNKGLPWYFEVHSLKNGNVLHIGGIDCGTYELACSEAIHYCLTNEI